MKIIYTILIITITVIMNSCTTSIFTPEENNFVKIKQWKYYTSQKKLDISEIPCNEFQDISKFNDLASLVKNREGWVYLRAKFIIPESLKNKDISLFLGRIIWNDRTWLNKKMIGKRGNDPPMATNHWNIPRLYNIPDSILNKEGENNILIRIYVHAEGALSDIPVIGPVDQLNKRHRLHTFLHVDINVIFTFFLLFIAVYHLLIYFYRKKDRSNLFYSLLLISFGLYNINMFMWAIPWLPFLPYLWIQKIVVLLELSAVFWAILFFEDYYQLNFSRKKKAIYYALLGIPVLLTLIPWNYKVFFLFRSIIMLFMTFFLFLLFFWALAAVIKKKQHSKALLVGVSFLIGGGIHDILLVVLTLNSGVYIAGWGFALFLFSIFFTLAKKQVSVYNEVEELNITLEDKVLKRTEELNNTLTEVKKLKEQQDGDYFLTTLLLKPLSNNAINSPNTRIQFYTEQKKHFIFRKYEKEIGGDLCTTHTIYLRGKPFTVFLNADAMGKSVQGAGGILVLGSVFQNIIERVHSVAGEKDLYPERWLKNTVKELHKIFESFDGSMLISAIIGLIDEETGLLYFINLEHPFLILYRDTKAEFIEKELKFHKLGTTGMEGQIFIDTFQLEQNDILFLGSDGKDDLRIVNADGEKLVNEDETLILRLIEKTGGNLEKLIEAIKETGDLMDDLSVMRIEYTQENKTPINLETDKKAKELVSLSLRAHKSKDFNRAIDYARKAQDEFSEHPETVKNLIKIYILTSKFEEASQILEDYIRNYPNEEDYLYLTSYVFRKIKKYSRAIDLGERIRTRNPANIKNLLNLARSYIAIKNWKRGQHINNKALEIDPQNSSALKIQELLREKDNES